MYLVEDRSAGIEHLEWEGHMHGRDTVVSIELLHRPKNAVKYDYNIYKLYPLRNEAGTIFSCIFQAVRDSQREIDFPLDLYKGVRLYSKSGIGLKKDKNGNYYVHSKKRFFKWVDKNIPKMLINRKKMEKEYEVFKVHDPKKHFEYMVTSEGSLQ